MSPDRDTLRFRSIPTNEIPVLVPLHLVLAHTDAIAVWLTGANVYSTCMTFSVEARVTTGDRFLGMYGFGKPESNHTPPMLLGFQNAEGTRATNLPGRRTGLSANGGGGNRLHNRTGLVLSPVPPAGPLDVHFAWPHFDLEEVQFTLDATEYASAAGRVTTLWEPKSPPTTPMNMDDTTVPEIEIPTGGWLAESFEQQKPPPQDPNAPRRINFAHIRRTDSGD